MLNSISLIIHLDNIQKIEPEIDCLNRFTKITYDNHKELPKKPSNEQPQYFLREYSEDFNEKSLDNSLEKSLDNSLEKSHDNFLYSF